MTSDAYRINKRSLIWFGGVLITCLIMADSLMLYQLKETLINEEKEHIKVQTNLLSNLLLESIIKNDYSTVENFVTRWGKDNANLAEITVTMDNGFKIAQFERPKNRDDCIDFEMQKSYLDKNIFSLSMSYDIQHVTASLINKGITTIVMSIIFVLGFGTLLWRTLRNTAIKPLEQIIEQHKQTEDALNIRTNELQAHSKELESYSYSIAHDLRSPVRTITSFGQILTMDAKEKLNDEEIESLRRIVDSGKYMAELIDDILALSRITRDKIHTEQVDISQLGIESIQRLRGMNPDTEIDIDIQDHMTTTGDQKLLGILLDNLLGNAWKYTAPNPSAQIKFGTDSTGSENGEVIFYVRDNGVGFDMKYVEKVFLPFQRLHTSQKFEGTGIGLATAKRIIDRHHGRIWIDSEEGVGTTVFFALNSSPDLQ